jgi:phage I-like protein
MTIALPTLYVIGVTLVLLGAAAVVISYLRTREDNKRHESLTQTLTLLQEGRRDLNEYHQVVRDMHDSAVTKMSVMMQRQEEIREAGRALDARARAVEQLEAAYKLNFPPELLAQILALSQEDWEVTGIVLRHVKSQVEVRVVERDHTWNTVQPRYGPRLAPRVIANNEGSTT